MTEITLPTPPTLHDVARANLPPLPDGLLRHVATDPDQPAPAISAVYLALVRQVLVLYNDLLWNTKHGKTPYEIDMLERGLSVLFSSYGARNLARISDDTATERTILALETKTAKPPRALRPSVTDSPRTAMLRELIRAHFLLNPTRKSTARLREEIIQLDGEVGPATRLLPAQGAIHNLRSEHQKAHHLYRNGKIVNRRSGALLAEPIYPRSEAISAGIDDGTYADTAAAKQGGYTYYMTPICDRLQHGVSPLYTYHATAWGMEQYARLLEQHGQTHCPILPYLSVQYLTRGNIGDMGADNSIRYLVEAKRHYLALMGRVRKVREGVYANATHSQRLGALPMYARMAAEEGMADVFGLWFVHECEPWYEPKPHTTLGQLRAIIEHEASQHGTSFDALDVLDTHDPLVTDL